MVLRRKLPTEGGVTTEQGAGVSAPDVVVPSAAAPATDFSDFTPPADAPTAPVATASLRQPVPGEAPALPDITALTTPIAALSTPAAPAATAPDSPFLTPFAAPDSSATSTLFPTTSSGFSARKRERRLQQMQGAAPLAPATPPATAEAPAWPPAVASTLTPPPAAPGGELGGDLPASAPLPTVVDAPAPLAPLVDLAAPVAPRPAAPLLPTLDDFAAPRLSEVKSAEALNDRPAAASIATSTPPAPVNALPQASGLEDEASLFNPHAGTPPWLQPTATGVAPSLTSAAVAPAAGHRRGWAMVALAGLALGAVYYLFQQNSGPLGQLAQTIKGFSQPQLTTDGILPPTDLNSARLGIAGEAQPPLEGMPLRPATDLAGATNIDFIDVPPSQVGQPIVADGQEPMPEEVGTFAALQKAIQDKRAEREARRAAQLAGTPDAASGGLAPPVVGDSAPIVSAERQSQLDREMEAYRRVLSSIDNPAGKPSPNSFFDDPNRFTGAAADLPTSPATVTPEGNPILAVPVENAQPATPPRVRTLDDFEPAMGRRAESQGPRIKLPPQLKPRLATGAFPTLEVLSLIPTYGLLANTGDRQGVLLIGDRYEGWELVGVYEAYAEFQSGERKHIVTLR